MSGHALHTALKVTVLGSQGLTPEHRPFVEVSLHDERKRTPSFNALGASSTSNPLHFGDDAALEAGTSLQPYFGAELLLALPGDWMSSRHVNEKLSIMVKSESVGGIGKGSVRLGGLAKRTNTGDTIESTMTLPSFCCGEEDVLQSYREKESVRLLPQGVRSFHFVSAEKKKKFPVVHVCLQLLTPAQAMAEQARLEESVQRARYDRWRREIAALRQGNDRANSPISDRSSRYAQFERQQLALGCEKGLPTIPVTAAGAPCTHSHSFLVNTDNHLRPSTRATAFCV
jgi:hypothetical protein